MAKHKTEMEEDIPDEVLNARWIIESCTDNRIPDFALPICARYSRGEITRDETEKLLIQGLADHGGE